MPYGQRIPSYQECLAAMQTRGKFSHAPNLWRGLAGLWLPQGAAGGRWLDLSGRGNHGTLTNMNPATDWVPSPFGLALDFDGVNTHNVVLPSTAPHIVGDFSVMAHVKVTAQTVIRGILADRNTGASGSQKGFTFGVWSTEVGWFQVDNGAGTYTELLGVVMAEGWHSVGGLFASGVGAYLYQDNVLVKSDVTGIPSGDLTGPNSTKIGSWGGSTLVETDPVAMVACWNRVVSAPEIAQWHYDPMALVRRRPFQIAVTDLSGAAAPNTRRYTLPLLKVG